MSAELINLKRERKRRDRDRKAAVAGERRALFGRTQGEKKAEDEAKRRFESELDGHKRL